MKLNIKVTDDVLETEGVWVDFPMGDGIRVKMTRSTAPAIHKHYLSLLKRNRKATRSEKVLKEVTTQFLADYVIVDWVGFKDGDEDFPYSKENAIIALKHSNDFYNWVENESQNILNFSNEENDTTIEERGEELKK